MEVQELMKGSYVQYHSEYCKVIAINPFDNNTVKVKSEIINNVFYITSVKHLCGIEIKKDKGFSICNEKFNGVVSVKFSPIKQKYYMYIGTIDVCEVKYVHEVQDFLYAVSGELIELKDLGYETKEN